jgi:hypothetical protein
MNDESDGPTVPVVCPKCETTTRVAIPDVAEAVDTHNDSRHDGRAVAHVDPDVLDRIADLVADDLGLTDDASDV